jgi:hypothetical protein
MKDTNEPRKQVISKMPEAHWHLKEILEAKR